MGKYTNLNKEKRAVSQVRDLYRLAPIAKLSSAELSARFVDILDTTLAKTPQAVRSYVRGWRDCLDAQIWGNLEFCYEVDGTLYTILKPGEGSHRPHYSALGDDWGPRLNAPGVRSAYFWKGSDKPFTELSERTTGGEHATE